MSHDPYADFLARLDGASPVERDVPLAPLTTFRIGGPADVLVRARTPEELAGAVAAARETGTGYFVLGRGANLLVGDGGFRGVVIRSVADGGPSAGIEFLDEVTVRAGAGVETFPDLIMATVERGLGGLHHYVGIPSTVGGALWQNLHFLSPERDRTCFIEEVLVGAEILTPAGKRERVGAEYFQFGYDESILHHHPDIVLSADFRLDPTPIEALRATIRANLEWRDERHPDLWLYPSAGSIFRKIDGIGAGRLIDEVGLKGHVRGGAGIFHKHANIIVNLGGATAEEVRALISLAQDTVLRDLGHELVPEIGFVGEF